MPKYVALLRGISPLNPNMRNKYLIQVFEDLGFKKVRTVITSGNVIFESKRRSKQQLEKMIEKAIHKQLGFFSTTIVRSDLQVKALMRNQPFGKEMEPSIYYYDVTFLKRGGQVFTSTEKRNAPTSNVMATIESEYGKEITTRTWKTVGRIVKAFGEVDKESRKSK
jgi:uncharacterized protein (DUF1697 family)